MAERPRLGILISGGGTTMNEVLKACESGEIDMQPVCIISSTDQAGGIAKAEDFKMGDFRFVRGRNLFIVSPKYHREGGRLNKEQYGLALLTRLQDCKVDFVSQNGWLPYTPNNVISTYEGRIVNQHPGTLDSEHRDNQQRRLDFGGEGMYGARVTCATVAYHWLTGEKIPTEASVHHVSEEPDGGPLIRVNTYWHPLFDNPATLSDIQDDPNQIIHATKVVQSELLPIEHRTVIEALGMLAKGENPLVTRDMPLVPERFADQLYQARVLAERFFPHG